MTDEHSHKKELEGLRDRNSQLVLAQHDLLQTNEHMQDELLRLDNEIERVDDMIAHVEHDTYMKQIELDIA